MASPSTLEPRLPAELERIVFEEAAAVEPRRVAELMLVASRVREWLEPLLYRIVASRDTWIRKTSSLDARFPSTFVTSLMKDKAESFLKSAVQVVLLAQKDAHYMEKIIPVCTKIHTLVVEAPMNETWEQHLPALNKLTALRRLCIPVLHLFPRPSGELPAPDVSMPLFATLTHLELLDYPRTQEHALILFNKLATLSSLTHLAFQGSTMISTLAQLLNPAVFFPQAPKKPRWGPHIQCLVVASEPDSFDGDRSLGKMLVVDPRVVVIARRGLVTTWMDEKRGFWAIADSLLKAKKDGTVAESEYAVEDYKINWKENGLPEFKFK
ncbi:unnamed protein product [Mycena citricolor]|uniref:Uncharacterized protein n=1 Tax=Mycena citricolor TaxID=2018698 RepID=A0AAD2GZP2_9AGAR|nr:unnamed protein product [Mycena citricolor]